MSSILDALNKLEKEKAAQQMDSSLDAVSATPEEAAAELLVEPAGRSSTSVFSVPWKPILAALLVGVALTSVTVTVTVWMVAAPVKTVASLPSAELSSPAMPVSALPDEKAPAPALTVNIPPSEPKETTLVHTYSVPVKVVKAEEAEKHAEHTEDKHVKATPESPPPPQEPVSVPVPAPAPVTEPVSVPAAPITIPASEPASEPAPVPAPEPVSVPEPVVVMAEQNIVPPAPPPSAMEAAQPAQHPLPDARTLMNQVEPAPQAPPPAAPAVVVAQVPARPRPEFSPPVVLTPPAARTESGPVDINTLPRLSVHERESFGLDAIRLNVLRPADKNQPDALAIINLKKVYVGEMIPGTQARLIGVDSGAIGVELDEGGSPKRYRIPK
jgi:hypothetical protein